MLLLAVTVMGNTPELMVTEALLIFGVNVHTAPTAQVPAGVTSGAAELFINVICGLAYVIVRLVYVPESTTCEARKLVSVTNCSRSTVAGFLISETDPGWRIALAICT